MPLHFNSFNNEMSSSSLDVRLLTTTLYILGGWWSMRTIQSENILSENKRRLK